MELKLHPRLTGFEIEAKPESSNIAYIGHREMTDNNSDELFVQFNNGNSYFYAGVLRNVFIDLRDAESVGRHFNQNIKNVFMFTEQHKTPLITADE